MYTLSSWLSHFGVKSTESIFRWLLIILFVGLGSSAFSQEVKDVRAQQNGNRVEIYYKIANSNFDQIFVVTIFYQNAKGLRTKLVHVYGDVGLNVIGGKEEYMISWDVLKDVDQLGEAEFIIKIEKQSKMVQVMDSNPAWFLAYNGASSFTPYGFRIGYGKSFGAFVAARFGSDGFEQSGDVVTSTTLFAATVRLSKEILHSHQYSIQVYAGAGIAAWGNYQSTSTKIVEGDESNQFQSSTQTIYEVGNADEGQEIEYGLIYARKRFQAGLGMAHNLGQKENHKDFVFSVGIRF